MSSLKVGFSRVNINPPLGIPIDGYFIKRFAKGFLDDLETEVIALSCGDKKIAVISVDAVRVETLLCNKLYVSIEKATGISKDGIFITATHTHTGPYASLKEEFYSQEIIAKYTDFLEQRIVDAVTMAFNDLKPAKMGYIVGYAPERVAYIRRYKMKDGTTMTCPPINDPDIDHPIGELDQRVNVIRFDREGADSVVIVNYGLHADTTNGELISADWPGAMRRTIEKALDGVQAVFLQGCEGDVGSTNVFPSGGDMNDTEISFDNEMKSPGMARFVGRALAGTVLQVYDKVNYTDVDEIGIISKKILIPSNKPKPDDMPLARKYLQLHEEGRDEEIPYEAMELTTVLAKAKRMCRLENGPENFEFELTGMKLGEVAFVGIPGEPFTDVGVGIKDTEGWPIILPCALTNGSEGYFPMMSAYDEGGYEALSSRFKAGVAEKIIEESKNLLNELKDTSILAERQQPL